MTGGPVHPVGFYRAYPYVTWDLAEERWLGNCGRSDLLIAVCLSCRWCSTEGELVLAKPERRRVAELIAGCQHWYECPGDPQVKFAWFEDVMNAPWSEELHGWLRLIRTYRGEPDGFDSWLRRIRNEGEA